MHSHPHTDSIWIVLDGEATFYAAAQGGSDRVAAKMKKNQGLLLKRGTPYWFESSGKTPLVIIHVAASDRTEVSSWATRLQTTHGGSDSEGAVVIEGKYFCRKK